MVAEDPKVAAGIVIFGVLAVGGAVAILGSTLVGYVRGRNSYIQAHPMPPVSEITCVDATLVSAEYMEEGILGSGKIRNRRATTEVEFGFVGSNSYVEYVMAEQFDRWTDLPPELEGFQDPLVLERIAALAPAAIHEHIRLCYDLDREVASGWLTVPVDGRAPATYVFDAKAQ